MRPYPHSEPTRILDQIECDGITAIRLNRIATTAVFVRIRGEPPMTSPEPGETSLSSRVHIAIFLSLLAAGASVSLLVLAILRGPWGAPSSTTDKTAEPSKEIVGLRNDIAELGHDIEKLRETRENSMKVEKEINALYERIDDLGSQVYQFEQGMRKNLSTMQTNLLKRMASLSAPAAAVPTDPLALKKDLAEKGVDLLKSADMLKLKGRFVVPRQALEAAACFEGGPMHETLLEVLAPPSAIYAGLVALGAKTGGGADYETGAAPTGDRVYIYLSWDKKKKPFRLEDLLYDTSEEKVMTDAQWVFSGSQFVTDFKSGEEYYVADSVRVAIALAYKYSESAVICCVHEKADNESIWLPTEDLLPKDLTTEIEIYVSTRRQEVFERERPQR